MNKEQLDYIQEITTKRQAEILESMERQRKEDPITHALDLLGFARQIDAERAKKREGK